jgi:hypothetical protein
MRVINTKKNQNLHQHEPCAAKHIPLFQNPILPPSVAKGFNEKILQTEFQDEILALKLVQILFPSKLNEYLEKSVANARYELCEKHFFKKDQYTNVEKAFRLILSQNLAPFQGEGETLLKKENPELFQRLIEEREMTKSALSTAVTNPYLKHELESQQNAWLGWPWTSHKSSTFQSFILEFFEKTPIGKIDPALLEQQLESLVVQEQKKEPSHWEVLSSYTASTTRGQYALGILILGFLLGKYGTKLCASLFTYYAEHTFSLHLLKIMNEFDKLNEKIIQGGLKSEIQRVDKLMSMNIGTSPTNLAYRKKLFEEFEPTYHRVLKGYQHEINSLMPDSFFMFEDYVLKMLEQQLFEIPNHVSKSVVYEYVKEKATQQTRIYAIKSIQKSIAFVGPLFNTLFLLSGVLILTSTLFSGINYFFFTYPNQKKRQKSYLYQQVQESFSHQTAPIQMLKTYLMKTLVIYTNPLPEHTEPLQIRREDSVSVSTFSTTFTKKKKTKLRSSPAPEESPREQERPPLSPKSLSLQWNWNGKAITEKSENVVLVDNRHGGKFWAYLDKETLLGYEQDPQFIRLEEEFRKAKTVRASERDSGHKTLTPAMECDGEFFTKEIKVIGIDARILGNPIRLPEGNDVNYLVMYDHFKAKAH